MLRGILSLRELYETIILRIKELLDQDLVGVIIFGSTVYLGRGRDIDLIVVVKKERDPRESLSLEYKLRRILEEEFKGLAFDVHVFSFKEFKENLKPGTFLSGLALGYEILHGEPLLEPLILEFLKELSREKYILHNKYGSWNLSHYAKITYNLKVKHRIIRNQMKRIHST